MTLLEGVLIVLLIAMMYFYVFNHVVIEKGKKKKLSLRISHIQKVALGLIILIIISLIVIIPTIDESYIQENLSYWGSLIGSMVGLTGAVLAALITIRLNKENKNIERLPSKYAKLKELRDEFSSFYTDFCFDIENEVLENPDEYMFKKFDEFLIFQNYALKITSEISNPLFLEFIDLFDQESKIALVTNKLWKKRGKIYMMDSIVRNYNMFKTAEGQQIIRNSAKNYYPDSNEVKVIDGMILYSIYIPAVRNKIEFFISKLSELDEEIREELLDFT